MALTSSGYQVVARNMAELLRWITEAAGQLEYYRGDHGQIKTD